jgi:hypothetical protein
VYYFDSTGARCSRDHGKFGRGDSPVDRDDGKVEQWHRAAPLWGMMSGEGLA